MNRHAAKNVIARSLPMLVLFALGACTGLSGSNVGDPSGYRQRQFMASLDRVHTGMSKDSVELLFTEATEAGDVGILKRSRLATEDFERITYTLGWLSDPRHQIGTKKLDEINVSVATVTVEGDTVRYIQRTD